MDPTDIHEWRMAALNDSRHRDALTHAPDHPGCPKCEPEPEENNNDHL